jgi:hypothetical protein
MRSSAVWQPESAVPFSTNLPNHFLLSLSQPDRDLIFPHLKKVTDPHETLGFKAGRGRDAGRAGARVGCPDAAGRRMNALHEWEEEPLATFRLATCCIVTRCC